MAQRRRRKKRTALDKATEARRAARQSGLRPAGTRVIQDKRKGPEKHKTRWLEEAMD